MEIKAIKDFEYNLQKSHEMFCKDMGIDENKFADLNSKLKKLLSETFKAGYIAAHKDLALYMNEKFKTFKNEH